jgi:hypothetical protein
MFLTLAIICFVLWLVIVLTHIVGGILAQLLFLLGLAFLVIYLVKRNRVKAAKAASQPAPPSPPLAKAVPTVHEKVLAVAPARVEPLAAQVLEEADEPEKASVGRRRRTKSIFISYRRQDSQHIAGRIYDQLVAQFGKAAVFKDVDSIPVGVNFQTHLQDQVMRTSVLVAIIGLDWRGSASGVDRLNDPKDYLRIEIETALDKGIAVIPVLVDGAEMPDESGLPGSLARLAYFNGIAIRPDPDFHHDAERLVRGIEALWGRTSGVNAASAKAKREAEQRRLAQARLRKK